MICRLASQIVFGGGGCQKYAMRESSSSMTSFGGTPAGFELLIGQSSLGQP